MGNTSEEEVAKDIVDKVAEVVKEVTKSPKLQDDFVYVGEALARLKKSDTVPTPKILTQPRKRKLFLQNMAAHPSSLVSDERVRDAMLEYVHLVLQLDSMTQMHVPWNTAMLKSFGALQDVIVNREMPAMSELVKIGTAKPVDVVALDQAQQKFARAHAEMMYAMNEFSEVSKTAETSSSLSLGGKLASFLGTTLSNVALLFLQYALPAMIVCYYDYVHLHKPTESWVGSFAESIWNIIASKFPTEEDQSGSWSYMILHSLFFPGTHDSYTLYNVIYNDPVGVQPAGYIFGTVLNMPNRYGAAVAWIQGMLSTYVFSPLFASMGLPSLAVNGLVTGLTIWTLRVIPLLSTRLSMRLVKTIASNTLHWFRTWWAGYVSEAEILEREAVRRKHPNGYACTEQAVCIPQYSGNHRDDLAVYATFQECRKNCVLKGGGRNILIFSAADFGMSFG
jgi:hypothetical protein